MTEHKVTITDAVATTDPPHDPAEPDLEVRVSVSNFRDEYYEKFIHITQGDRAALVIYNEPVDLEWASKIARLLSEEDDG